MHFVLPAAPPSGLTMLEMVEEAALPGPLRFTRVLEVEVHILAFVAGVGGICEEQGDRFGGLMMIER